MWERYIHLFSKYPLLGISDIITLFPLIIGLGNFKYLSKEFKFLYYFLIVHFIFDLRSTWLSIKMIDNIFIFNISEIIEVASIGIIFYQLNTHKIKRLLVSLLFLICIIVGIWKFDFIEFAYIPYVVNRLSYVIIVFIYFNTLLSEISVKNILTHPPFWLCAGLIVYSTGSLLIFLFGKHIFSINAPDELFLPFYNIISIINIIFRLLIGISFFVSKYEKQ